MVQEIIPSCPEQQPTKWEPKAGKWYVSAEGKVQEFVSSKESKEFGMEYQTKEQAEWAAKQMRSFNRQLAWLAEHDDGWKADWTNVEQRYYIRYNHNTGIYFVSSNWSRQTINTIYMSRTNAELLAQQLNDGIVKL